MLVRHVKEVADQVELLSGYESPDSVIKSIQNKEKILFLLTEKEYKKPIAEWDQYMFDAKQLDENYYYSIVKGELTDSVNWDRVCTIN